jgi:hypothetical protein
MRRGGLPTSVWLVGGALVLVILIVLLTRSSGGRD